VTFSFGAKKVVVAAASGGARTLPGVQRATAWPERPADLPAR